LVRYGVKAVRLPARSPNLNAFAERFVLSIKSECVDRIVPLGEAHLRRAIWEYVAHYHHERKHQGIENRLIASDGRAESGIGGVAHRECLGGLLSFYYREAA
jgi:putative transposase